MSEEELQKLFRFGVVGVLQNCVSYLCYLLLVWMGISPQLAITVIYPFGITASFLANRKWTFSHQGSVRSSYLRFVVAHFFGYLLNILLLYLFVDGMHYPHALVQAVATLVVAAYLFVVFRLWVFPERCEKER